jgi:hypothetical protein
MSANSPFAGFYNKVFATASPEQKEAFLQELFLKNAALCYSFQSFINPDLHSQAVMESIAMEIENQTANLQHKIKTYSWSVLWDVDGQPENYDEDLIRLLEEKFVGYTHFPIESLCSTGRLLEAVASLRIIELSLNIDWESVEEPAQYYGREVDCFISYQFDDLISSFIDHVFSKGQVRSAMELIADFKSKPGLFFDHSVEWQKVEDVFREYIVDMVI